jgi:cytochrome c biogenesis protein CcmG/thiol:disulfide interchange protein DsbE
MATRPSENRRRLLALAALLPLLAGGCDAPAPRLVSGDPAPSFALTQLNAASLRFPDDFQGRPVIIRFWADWCRFCEEEMKDIESVYQQHRTAGLTVLAVNVGQSPETIAGFVKKIGVTYPALVDEESSVAKRYGVLAVPTTYFVDRNGIIRAKLVGEAQSEAFERMAREIL